MEFYPVFLCLLRELGNHVIQADSSDVKGSHSKHIYFSLFSDVTDIRVLLDRNNLPEFKLDFDNNIVLGMPKLMHLEVEVEVDGK